MSQIGPTTTVERSCFACTYNESESYRVQGDSGFSVRCGHPQAPERPANYIGDTNWNTPGWCPVLVQDAHRNTVHSMSTAGGGVRAWTNKGRCAAVISVLALGVGVEGFFCLLTAPIDMPVETLNHFGRVSMTGLVVAVLSAWWLTSLPVKDAR